MNKIIVSVFLTATVICFTNCKPVQNANNKQKGAVIGAVGGSLIGAILGNNLGKGGNSELGAVIGGVVGGGAGVLVGSKMDKQAQKIEEEIPGAEVERVEDGIVITFDETSGVYFETNKYIINKDSQVILDKLVKVLQEYTDTKILVVGHTDSRGRAEYNMELSKNRAQAVNRYFKKQGILPSRLSTKWFGKEQPAGDNNTEEGRAKNRRVNVVILPSKEMIIEAEKEAKALEAKEAAKAASENAETDKE